MLAIVEDQQQASPVEPVDELRLETSAASFVDADTARNRARHVASSGEDRQIADVNPVAVPAADRSCDLQSEARFADTARAPQGHEARDVHEVSDAEQIGVAADEAAHRARHRRVRERLGVAVDGVPEDPDLDLL